MEIRHTLTSSWPARLLAAVAVLLLAALAFSQYRALAESPTPGAPGSVTVTRADGTVTAS